MNKIPARSRAQAYEHFLDLIQAGYTEEFALNEVFEVYGTKES